MASAENITQSAKRESTMESKFAADDTLSFYYFSRESK